MPSATDFISKTCRRVGETLPLHTAATRSERHTGTHTHTPRHTDRDVADGSAVLCVVVVAAHTD
eukprot:2286954-Rhodomonas_salina.1